MDSKDQAFVATAYLELGDYRRPGTRKREARSHSASDILDEPRDVHRFTNPASDQVIKSKRHQVSVDQLKAKYNGHNAVSASSNDTSVKTNGFKGSVNDRKTKFDGPKEVIIVHDRSHSNPVENTKYSASVALSNRKSKFDESKGIFNGHDKRQSIETPKHRISVSPSDRKTKYDDYNEFTNGGDRRNSNPVETIKPANQESVNGRRSKFDGHNGLVNGRERRDSDTTESPTSASNPRLTLKPVTRRNQKPSFIIKPRKQFVNQGDIAKFKASCEGEPPPTLHWEHRGQQLNNSNKYKVYSSSDYHFLEVHDVNLQDKGNYICVIHNHIGSCQEGVQLEVFGESRPSSLKSPKSVAPRFEKRLENQSVKEHQTLNLECTVTGYPEPQVVWYKDGKQLRNIGSVRKTFDGKKAKIAIWDVSGKDCGTYECVCSNSLGEDRTSCVVKITEIVRSPKTEKEINKKFLSNGSSHVVTSTLSRSPGKPTNLSSKISKIMERYQNSQSQTEVSDDKKTKDTLHKAKAPSTKELPAISTHLTNACVTTGDVLCLQCSVLNASDCTVCWYHNDQPLLPQKLISMDFDGSAAQLQIYNVKKDNSGDYMCVFSCMNGKAMSAAVVTVTGCEDEPVTTQNLYSPKVTDTHTSTHNLETRAVQPNPVSLTLPLSPVEISQKNNYTLVTEKNNNVAAQKPVFIKEPTSITATEGEAVEFVCEVSSLYDAEVTWCKKDITISRSDRLQLSEDKNVHYLKIGKCEVSDSGRYSVTASNPVGEELSTFSLVVKLMEHTGHSALFKSRSKSMGSTPKEQNKIVQHDFRSVLKPKPNHVEDSVETKHVEMVVKLAETKEEKMERPVNAKEYTKENIALIEKDKEPLKRRSRTKCPPVIEDIGPDNLHVVRGSAIKLKAKFMGDPELNVRWSKYGQQLETDGRVHIETDSTLSTLTIDNSVSDDTGRYYLTVENELSDDKVTATVTVEDRPNPPVGKPAATSVTSTSATLSWYGPNFDGRSQVTNYTLEMHVLPDGSWQKLTETCKNTSYQVTDLSPDTEYRFRVRAGNKHGFSDPSLVSDIVSTIQKKSLIQPDELSFEPKVVTIDPSRRFEQQYDMHEEIGKGKFGNVYKCLEKKTGRTWAAKVIKCRPSQKKDMKQEIEVMNELHHPKLLLLWDAFEYSNKMVLVMEHVSGGELFERIIDDDYILTERECIHFMRQICEGVRYMHSKNILHLDLKPENVLCITKNSNEVKLIDFGLARPYDPTKDCRVLFGTPEFVAPEVINYDQISYETDMWSVGVICYTLLSGLSPFLGDLDSETLVKVTMAEYDFDDEVFDEISDDAKSFIEALLKKKKEKRLSAEACLGHRWMVQDVKVMKAKRLSTEKHKRFMARAKWQKTGNAIRALGRLSLLKKSLPFSQNKEDKSNVDDARRKGTPAIRSRAFSETTCEKKPETNPMLRSDSDTFAELSGRQDVYASNPSIAE